METSLMRDAHIGGSTQAGDKHPTRPGPPPPPEPWRCRRSPCLHAWGGGSRGYECMAVECGEWGSVWEVCVEAAWAGGTAGVH